MSPHMETIFQNLLVGLHYRIFLSCWWFIGEFDDRLLSSASQDTKTIASDTYFVFESTNYFTNKIFVLSLDQVYWWVEPTAHPKTLGKFGTSIPALAEGWQLVNFRWRRPEESMCEITDLIYGTAVNNHQCNQSDWCPLTSMEGKKSLLKKKKNLRYQAL